jgi:Flp pilus assembly protein TadG
MQAQEYPTMRTSALPSRLSGFLRHDGGVAAVEFSLILPILVVLWIGGLELTGALSVDRRLNNFGSSIGDLVARTKSITYAQIADIFDLAPAAMFPYSATGMSMRVTAIDIDADGNSKVAWSRAEGTALPAYVKDTPMNSVVPATLRVADSQIIMSEVQHTYSPAVGYVITGDVELDDRMFFVPRLVKQVKICPTDDTDSCVTSI